MQVKKFWPPVVPSGPFKVDTFTELLYPNERMQSEQSSMFEDSSHIKYSDMTISQASYTDYRPPEQTGILHHRQSSTGSRYEVIVLDESMESSSRWCTGCYDRYDNENHTIKSFCSLF